MAAADENGDATTSSPVHPQPARKMDGILNFRDLADATVNNKGSVLASGRVFRTATPGGATSTDASVILTDLRVSRLLDLRSADEWEPEPGPLLSKFALHPFSREAADANLAFDRALAEDDRAGRLVRYHAPLLDYDRYYAEILTRMSAWEKVQAAIFTAQAKLVNDANQRRLFVGKVNQGGLFLLNEVIVDSSGPEMCAALAVVAASSERTPTAFYCKAGKDRTGLVAALSLHCCGVSDGDIIADYHRSHGVRRAALGGGQIENGLAVDYSRFRGAPEEVMEHVLAYIRRRYGSLDGYLDSIGFDRDKRRRLAAALCE